MAELLAGENLPFDAMQTVPEIEAAKCKTHLDIDLGLKSTSHLDGRNCNVAIHLGPSTSALSRIDENEE